MLLTALNQVLAQVDRVQVERRLEFAASPTGWAAVAMLAVAAGILWLVAWFYRHEGRAGASMRWRMVMAAIRCVVMATLISIWLQPVLATYLHRSIDSYTVVLVDTSSSMDLQDRYRTSEDLGRVKAVMGEAAGGPLRRSDLVQRILGRDGDRFLHALAARNRVKVYTFADEPEAAYTLRAAREGRFDDVAGPSPPGAEQVLQADSSSGLPTSFPGRGAATDVGRALRQSVEALGRSPLAGVVLLTDGGINQGDSAETVARYARDKRVPLHVVGIGDPSPPRNIRVAEIIAPDNVFAEDPYAIVAQITGQGMAGQTVSVELFERRAESDDEGRCVATQSVTIEDDNIVEPLTFQHRQKTVGRYNYRVAAAVSAVESVADDNSKQVTVNVIENRLRVLLIAGAANWEYRYLSRLLQRDATFELACWLQSADDNAVRDGNVILDHLPTSPEELFEYDAVIMLDPDPVEVTAEFADRLAELVTHHGGGLLFSAARLHTPSFMRDPDASAIVTILPVTPDPDADLVLNQIGHYQQRGNPIEIPSTALGHPAIKLPGGADSPFHWQNVGTFYWHYPVLREKPVASVLMRHGDPRMQNAYGRHVLLATQYVGAGRTAFLAIDGTWRWRAHSEEIFNKFWVQMIRYLVEGKLAGGNRRGTILTERDTYQLGEVVQVTARLFDKSFKPLQTQSVQATCKLGDEQSAFSMERIIDRPGWYEGRLVPRRTGGCELMLTIPDSEMEGPVVRREVEIVRPNLEILQPQMNRELLVGLADQSHGGRYYDVDAAAQLPDQIPDRHESTTIRSRPVPLWDDKWVLILLVALLSVEWVMRKLSSLL